MYVSKFMLDNPNLNLYDIDPALIERARKIYEHFENNSLFYVDCDRRSGHVFFDGKYGVEVTKQHVRFLDDVNAESFVVVDFNDTQLVKHGRSLKPIIYYPILEPGYKMRTGQLGSAEQYLLEKYKGLSKFCLFNRVHGWTVDICDNTYPLNPSASLSMHTVKIQNWFKSQYAIVSTLNSKCYGNRVSSIRFVA